MDINGRSTDDVDSVVWEDDYFEPAAIERFLDRLNGTDRAEQFLFRESEFDCAFRQVDMRIAELRTAATTTPEELATAQKLRDEVWEGHEQIGAQNAERAAMAWRRMAILLADVPAGSITSGE